MKNFYFKISLLTLICMITSQFSFGQTTIYTQDFETLDDGYTASSTSGSGTEDVFNRTNPGVGGNSTFIWALEDTNETPASITLDQIDITGYSDFTFSIDLLAHHFEDWDSTDEMNITYSIDGGSSQNLLSVQMHEGTGDNFNGPAAIDTDFNGDGECGASTILPALTTGTQHGCTVSDSEFANFSSATIPLASNSTLDIIISFVNLDGTDEGIYLDNIEVVGTPATTNPTVGFQEATSSENETNTTFTSANIPIEVTNYDGNQIDVDVAITGGTAEPTDYTYTTQSLMFTSNSIQNITIDINPDADFDDETVIFTITETSSVTGLVIQQSTHTLTITDDELPPAGWQITATNTSFEIDFEDTVSGVNNDEFDGTGFSSSPALGQLDSGSWATSGMSDSGGSTDFGDTETSGDYARGLSSGGVSTGGFYSFETSVDNFSLGFQGTGSDFTPGWIKLRAQNQTGEVVSIVDLNYLIYVYNDQGRSNTLNFSYSTDDITYTPVASLDFSSATAADGSPSWVSNVRDAEISGLNIPVGGFFYMRWESDDNGGSGSRDEISIDDIEVIFNPSITTTTYTYDETVSPVWSPMDPIGNSTGADDIVILNGTAVISGELIGNNLTVASGATLDLDPSSVLDLDGDIANDGIILFNSDMTGSAQFDEFDGAVAGTGEVTVERYISARRAYRLLASSVDTSGSINDNWQEGVTTEDPNPNPNPGFGTHITGGTAVNGFDQNGTTNASMYTFDNLATPANPNAAYDPVPNTSTLGLNTMTPYAVAIRGDRSIDITINNAVPTATTLRATGDLKTGSATYSSGVNLSSKLDGFSLIANPYQAVVDFSLVQKTDITDFIYIWDASIGFKGGYVTIDHTTNTVTDPIPNPGSDASVYIAPGMSFFVQNDNSASASITFEEDDKRTDEAEVTVFDTYPNFYINAALYSSTALQNGEREKDAIGLRFASNFTTAGSLEDASKLFNPDENFAVINNGLKSIDKQGLPQDGHIVQFSLTNYTEQSYSLTFDIENKPQELEIVLVDHYLNTQTLLSDNFIFDFSVDANIPESLNENRFSLIFNNSTLGINQNTFGKDFELYPNPTFDGIFNINTPQLSGKVNIELHNLLGQVVLNQDFIVENQKLNINANDLPSGVYIVKLSQGNSRFSAKLVIE